MHAPRQCAEMTAVWSPERRRLTPTAPLFGGAQVAVAAGQPMNPLILAVLLKSTSLQRPQRAFEARSRRELM